MADRGPFKEVFVSGIMNFDGRITQVFLQEMEGDKPPYPYVSFSINLNGAAPFEPNQPVLNDRELVDSSDPDFDRDIKQDYSRVNLLTVSHSIVGEVSDPLTEIVDSVESYWLYKFKEDAKEAGLDMGILETNSAASSLNNVGGIREKRHDVDAQVKYTLSNSKTVATIEKMKVDSDSDIAGGETFG